MNKVGEKVGENEADGRGLAYKETASVTSGRRFAFFRHKSNSTSEMRENLFHVRR